MKTCPHCRKRIDVAAVKCAYCQSIFDGSQMAIGRKEQTRSGIANFALILLTIFIAIYLLTRPETIDRLADESARQKIHGEMSSAN